MNNFPVRVYAADVRTLEDEQLFEKAYRKVTVPRRKKTDQMRFSMDKCRSLGAELLLLYGLSELGLLEGEYRGGEYLAPEFRYGENGKPYLDGAEGIYFNLSHSGNLAVCAIAPCEVGCDVEKIREQKTAVARRFFTPAEYEKIVSLEDTEARQKMFCRIWTLKESFLKVTGQGLRLGMDSFQFIFGEDKISVIQNVDQRAYCFREYETAKGYCCAVCAVQEEFEEKVRRVNLADLVYGKQA